MTLPPGGRVVVLGLFPTSRGLGWAAFNGPLSLIDFGIFTATTGRSKETPSKNGQCLTRVDRLMARLMPEHIVLEVYAPDRSRRSTRVAGLCKSIETLARDRGLAVSVIPRAAVHAAFVHASKPTRDQVAAAVALSVPELAPRLPKPRRTYDSENKALAAFNAAALVLTHYENEATALLNELRNAA